MSDIHSELRKKVARAINPGAWAHLSSQDRRMAQADAAIVAVIECLIDMELPEEALLAADEVPADYAPEFRAILTAFKHLFEKND